MELSYKTETHQKHLLQISFMNDTVQNEKKMLQGLYNIVNGGPTHYWGKCNAEFIGWSMEEISVSPVSQNIPAKNVNIRNLEYYA